MFNFDDLSKEQFEEFVRREYEHSRIVRGEEVREKEVPGTLENGSPENDEGPLTLNDFEEFVKTHQEQFTWMDSIKKGEVLK